MNILILTIVIYGSAATVSGEMAHIFDALWQASIVRGVHGAAGPFRLLAAASLVRSDVLLGSELDSFNFDNTYARAGTPLVGLGGQTRSFLSVAHHVRYNKTTRDYGICLYKTREPFIIDNLSLKPIPLILEGEEFEDGTVATTSGFGSLKADGSPLEYLHIISMQTVDSSSCQLNVPEQLTSRMMCAGPPGACLGDLGAPLVVQETLLGVAAWPGCNTRPTVWLSVAVLRSYVDIVLENFDTGKKMETLCDGEVCAKIMYGNGQ